MAAALRYGEFLFSLLALAFFTGLQVHVANYLIGEPLQETLTSLIRYSVVAGSFLLLLFRWRQSLFVAHRACLLWLLVILDAASYFWSEIPDWTYLSIRGELLPMVLFGLYFGSRYCLREQLQILAPFFIMSAIGSFLVVFLLPEVGKHPLTEFDGAWRGLYGHKNGLSAYMSISVLAQLSILLSPKKENIINPKLAWIGLALSVALILLSTSATGLLLLVFLFTLLLLYRRYRWQGKRSVLVLNIGIGLGVVAIILVILNWGLLLAALGKDPTLTSRALIWENGFSFWLDKFFLGYGRDAFWNPDLPYAYQIGSKIAFNYLPPHAHNGFLDTALEVGIIGLGLFIAGLVLSLIRVFGWPILDPVPPCFGRLASCVCS
ncbi:MAG: O-antigen ligase family protein [Leptolyngbyaceae cyanobacterium SM2_3_12]|nr:O-antigen ligase family protein [Leptolyngbyaceae cyanobacterium SM2_3_12]